MLKSLEFITGSVILNFEGSKGTKVFLETLEGNTIEVISPERIIVPSNVTKITFDDSRSQEGETDEVTDLLLTPEGFTTIIDADIVEGKE